MPLDPYSPGPLYRGSADLVGALMGGDAVEAQAREKLRMTGIAAQSAEAGLDKKITDALLARDKRKAQGEYEAKLIADGMNPATAGVVAGAMIGGDANLEQGQKYALRGQLPAAFQAEGVTPANALAAALQGKPLPGVDIDSGNIVRGQYGAAPTVTPTEETIGQIAARAATANAQARVNHAKADAGGWNPATPPRKGTQVEQAKAIIEAVAADAPGAAVGHSPRSIAKRIGAGLDIEMRETPQGSLRWITADGVRDIPVGRPPNGNAPVPIDVQESTERPVKSVNRPKPSPGAVKLLWSNPALADKFAARYGRTALQSALAAKP